MSYSSRAFLEQREYEETNPEARVIDSNPAWRHSKILKEPRPVERLDYFGRPYISYTFEPDVDWSEKWRKFNETRW